MIFKRPSRRRGKRSQRLSDGLIKRASAGDQEAFSLLYKNHVDIVFGYVSACGVNSPEDVTFDIFAEARHRLPGFDRSRDEFPVWLMTIAYRFTADAVGWQATLAAASSEGPAAAPTYWPSTPGTEPVLLLAFSRLTMAQREVLALRFVADLGIEHIGLVTNRGVGAVKSLQDRGLQTMREVLAEAGISDEVLTR